ncbi:MAG: hypothetical protein IJW99_01070 [Clostridia bacterium]|nr:hypothetical protein [Clostridia bacterium]
MDYIQATAELERRYRQIFRQKGVSPSWAYRKTDPPQELIHCPVPFVGKHYFEQPIKILLYASAENLNGYHHYLDDDDFAIRRHRYYFDRSLEDPETFFPWVHIAPINNGALVLCAFHILSRLTDPGNMSPSEFLETISFGNYGKYTICPHEGSRNVDYASQPQKLKESQEYVAVDIEVLKPDYIIMVGTIYHGAGQQKEFIDRIKGDAKIIPIYQITPTTVNSPNLFRKFGVSDLRDLHPTLTRWYPHFRAGAVSGKYFMSVFSYLDHVLEQLT